MQKYEVEENNKCIVCGNEAPNGPQCKNCYYESRDYKEQIDKNQKLYNLQNYYYNLHGAIYRMKDFEKIQSNCNKLFAIAQLTQEIYNNENLITKVIIDIPKILEKKKPKEEKRQEIKQEEKKQDSQLEKQIETADGHLVKSDGESIIDDILYNHQILHSYDQRVTEVDNYQEQDMKSDWFIPIIGAGKGIYIEYWGMKTKEYLENKKRKIETYNKYKLPIIEIQQEEPLKDRNNLTAKIKREIRRLAKEYYEITLKN